MITIGNQIELRHFRYFLAVAETLHFRKAAEKLYVSQPGLSRQIKQMETLLGARLFERDRKKVVLTPAGEYFKAEAKYVLQHIDKVYQHTHLIDAGVKGEVKVGFVGSAMQKVIPQLLIRSNTKYPGINFSFEEMSNSNQVDKLVSDTLDVGFLRLNRVPGTLDVKPIFEETFSLVLPENHPVHPGAFESMAQMANESFILFQPTYSPLYFDKVMSICEDQGFRPKVVHNTVHANTIFRLVENGMGVSIVPSSLQNGVDLKIKFIELKKIPQRAILYVAWNKSNRNPSFFKFKQVIDDSLL
ncbi:MAG: LysR family transcriptional regulator [Cyclobacteriaceae bacterium]